ncbi:tRNA (cytidine(34)-2'-O)-methyltransferase [Rhizobium albus]|nr:tRNA (cytidine(34)-2'-O)-methyltransferase [Rhizobium albus]
MQSLSLALFQPDIPGNSGTILRMAACLGLSVHIIEPAGFDLSDKALKRAGIDYAAQAALVRHINFDHFEAWRSEEKRRLVLATTKGAVAYTNFRFDPSDILLFGRESAGVPDDVHALADARILIPMQPGMRSLNLAISTAMVAGEALRQTGAFAVE